jgi:hypothetical protein
MDLPKPCEHDSADNPLRPWCAWPNCISGPPPGQDAGTVWAQGVLWCRIWSDPGWEWRKAPTLPVPGRTDAYIRPDGSTTSKPGHGAVGRAAGAFAAAVEEQVRQMQEAAHARGLQAIGYAQAQQPETMLGALASMPAELMRHLPEMKPEHWREWHDACRLLLSAHETLTNVLAAHRNGRQG